MRRILFALPLLAATAGLAGIQAQSQTASPPASAASLQLAQAEAGLRSVSAACPVGMTARQQAAGETVWTIALEDAGRASGPLAGQPRGQQPGDARNDAAPGAAGTGVHVDVKAWKGGPIRQVELAVHYLAPGWRLMPVGAAKPGDDLQKTYNLAAADGGSLKLAGDLLVGATAGITRVTLLRIDYADGTSWHASSREACSVAPNGFTLVGAR